MKKGWVFIRRSAFFCQSVASLASPFPDDPKQSRRHCLSDRNDRGTVVKYAGILQEKTRDNISQIGKRSVMKYETFPYC